MGRFRVDTEIRPIEPDDFLAFVSADEAAFSHHHDPEETERWRKVFEFDRSLAVFRLVAHRRHDRRAT